MGKTSEVIDSEFIDDLKAIVGPPNVMYRPSEQAAYESDAYPLESAKPLCIVLPVSHDEVVDVVRLCGRHKVCFAPRGAGTGLAGGTLVKEGVSIGLSRMDRITEIDLRNRRLTAEAGVINTLLSKSVRSEGFCFAPDPSSQSACTLGGNIANNAGGPHTLKYGVTVNHLVAADIVLPDGETVSLGDKTEDVNGYDLLSQVCGGEGTLGIVTQATVRLTPLPTGVQMLLAVFSSIEDATLSVTRILASGIVPAALEMLDQQIIATVEDAFHYGFPRDAAAVLIVEVDGGLESIDRQSSIVKDACVSCNASEVRLAVDSEDRSKLWSARKKAIGTLGRLAPGIVTQDGVIPRSKLPDVLIEIASISLRYNLRIANVFHAGDGNLHPAVLFNPEVAGELERVHGANSDILNLCIRVGGTLSGEHGIGVEKREFMHLAYPEASLNTMANIRSCFNPNEICNPGKVLPSSHGCSFEMPQRTKGASD